MLGLTRTYSGLVTESGTQAEETHVDSSFLDRLGPLVTMWCALTAIGFAAAVGLVGAADLGWLRFPVAALVATAAGVSTTMLARYLQRPPRR